MTMLMSLASSVSKDSYSTLPYFLKRLNEHADFEGYAVVLLRTKTNADKNPRKAWIICDRKKINACSHRTRKATRQQSIYQMFFLHHRYFSWQQCQWPVNHRDCKFRAQSRRKCFFRAFNIKTIDHDFDREKADDSTTDYSNRVFQSSFRDAPSKSFGWKSYFYSSRCVQLSSTNSSRKTRAFDFYTGVDSTAKWRRLNLCFSKKQQQLYHAFIFHQTDFSRYFENKFRSFDYEYNLQNKSIQNAFVDHLWSNRDAYNFLRGILLHL